MLRIGAIIIRVDDLRPADADHVILADSAGSRVCVIDAGTEARTVGSDGAGHG